MPARPGPPPAVTVVGIGADGWEGLPEASRRALREAEVLIGGPRQLGLLPHACAGERIVWPSPPRSAVPRLLAEHADRRIAVLASGDPMLYGIGRVLAGETDAPRVLPHPSSVSHAAARLGRPVEDVEVVTLVGRPTASLAAALHHGRRLLVPGADADTPGEVAALLSDRGFGPSRIRVPAQPGGDRERMTAETTAEDWVRAQPAGDPLNIVAIEWMRTHPSCRAITVERDPVRAGRITRNAERLGVPALRVVAQDAPAALSGLPVPDAVFVGGGLTAPGLIEACWDALPTGGRLVANTVTLESEALFADAYRRHGGELVRFAVAHAVPVGGFTGWRQAMPVTQWSVEKTLNPVPGAGR